LQESFSEGLFFNRSEHAIAETKKYSNHRYSPEMVKKLDEIVILPAKISVDFRHSRVLQDSLPLLTLLYPISAKVSS